MMMWPLGLFAAFSLLGNCFGQDYQPALPAPVYDKYMNVEAELNKLSRDIQTFLSRDNTYLLRIVLLTEAASSNLGFKFEFKDVFQPEINNEQAQQQKRLDALAKKIAQIKELEAQVRSFQKAVIYIKNDTAGIIEADKKVMKTINNLTTFDDDLLDPIDEAQNRSDTVKERLDVVSQRIFMTSRTIYAQELIIKHIIVRLNALKAAASEVILYLNKDGSANATMKYPGFPTQVGAFLTGFLLSKLPSRKPLEDPSIYFSLDAFGFDGLIQVHARDTSTGTWKLEEVSFVTLGLSDATSGI